MVAPPSPAGKIAAPAVAPSGASGTALAASTLLRDVPEAAKVTPSGFLREHTHLVAGDVEIGGLAREPRPRLFPQARLGITPPALLILLQSR
jgi:hypothetical protein